MIHDKLSAGSTDAEHNSSFASDSLMVFNVFLVIGIVDNKKKEKINQTNGTTTGSIMIPSHVVWMNLFWQPQA